MPALRRTLALLLALLALAPPARAAADAPPADSPVIRPGREAVLDGALRGAGVVCADGGGCDYRARIEGAVVRVVADGVAGTFLLRHGSDPACFPVAGPVVTCPASDAPVHIAAASRASTLLRAAPEQARALASLWADDGAPTAVVPPLQRLLDVVAALWVLLAAAGVALGLRRVPAADRWAALAVTLVGAGLRLALPPGPANFYFPVLPEGPFPDAFTAAIPPVLFDTPFRLAAWLGASDRFVFGVHLVLSAAAAGVALLAARLLAVSRRPAAPAAPGPEGDPASGAAPPRAPAGPLPGASRLTAWLLGALLAAHPYLVRLGHGDAYQNWTLAAFATALLGCALLLDAERRRLRALGGLLAVTSLVLGAAARLETAPGLFLAPLLVLAMVAARGGRLRPALGPLALVVAAAGLAALALAFDALRQVAAAERGLEFARAAPLPSLLRLLGLRDATVPTAVWAAALAPALVLGAARLLATRRAVAGLLWLAALLLAAAPLLATGRELDHRLNWRYVLGLYPVALWGAAAGLAWLHDALAPRLRSAAQRLGLAAVSFLPVVVLLAGAWPRLAVPQVIEAEYGFLADALGELPEDCAVTALTSLPPVALPDAYLGLPHALLALRHPHLRWSVSAPGGEGPRDTGAPCQAVYQGALCEAVRQGYAPTGGPLADFIAANRAGCRALADLAAPGVPVAAARQPVTLDTTVEHAFREAAVTLRLVRLR